jgi:hypothetical protein
MVEPREINDLLANPGMGWQTFHTFADQDPALQGLPSGSAYFRLYWRDIEPQEGKIDFEKLDGLLAQARKAGQRLSLRVMCAGERTIDVPEWLKSKGCRGYDYTYEGQRFWIPDFEDPQFQRAHFRLIRELGKRYADHPDLDLVDVGSVGLWGEWHLSGAIDVATGKEVPLPSPETRRRIVDAWCAAFPNKPRAMLIGGEDALRYALGKGCGWRADCLGDMGGFAKNWNHMQNLYPDALRAAEAENAWKRGPVAFESCWDMRKWHQEGWDVTAIFDYALRHHASYVNNKSAPLPEGARPEVERLLRRLGYRLVLRRAVLPRSVQRGKPAPIRLNWENKGVAPPYSDYRIALRFAGESAAAWVSPVSVRGWLPGTKSAQIVLPISKGLTRGNVPLEIALVDPKTKQPAVRLAVAGRKADGWYPLASVQVR